MHCPRLDHFVRLDHTGKIGKCGHMTGAKTFDSVQEMQESEWLAKIRDTMDKDQWPDECKRCHMTEQTSQSSIRLDMIERDRILRSIRKDYLIVGGVLDNTCNSACQSCNAELSTKIGSLISKNYKKINNLENFMALPQERIVELDINGGEPTASPVYKKLLSDLPSAVKIVRVNTNGSLMIPEITKLLEQNIRVIITLSFDGTDEVHDYVRWPIRWSKFQQNVSRYVALRDKFKTLRLNCWTTVSCLNVADIGNVLQYCEDNRLDHAYGFCIRPTQLDIRHRNHFTTAAKQKLLSSSTTLLREIGARCATLSDNSDDLRGFIEKQDNLRGIDVKDYFNFFPK